MPRLLQVLILGGGIANFTNVAATFKGIVTALLEFQPKLVEHNISLYVRRAGPNYQEGLRYDALSLSIPTNFSEKNVTYSNLT